MADFYELFNQIDGEAESYEKTELNGFDKAKMMRSAHQITKCSRARRIRKIAAACAVFLLFGTVACRNESVQAAVEYFSGHLFEHFGGREETKEYISTVNRSQEYNDYKVTLKEAALDTEYLTLAFIVEGKEKLEGSAGVDFGNSDIFINGKEMKEEYEGEIMMLDPYHTQIILKFKQKELYKKDTVDLAVRIHELLKPDEASTQDSDDLDKVECTDETVVIEGNWSFQCKLDTKDIAKKTEVITIDKEYKADGGMSIDIEQLKISPLDLNLITKEVWMDTEDELHMFEIEGIDDKGNPLSFNMTGSSKECIYNLSSYDGSLNDCQSITLTVYLITSYRDQNQKMTREQFGEPIVIDMSDR